MKKAYIILSVLFIAALINRTAYAQPAVCGEALYSDIRAYINGLPVQSYNIGGWTGVVAEDLRAYGFEVLWDGDSRSLYVADANRLPVTAGGVPEAAAMPAGSHAAYVYATDIKTYVAGWECPAYNIGGQTVILIDSLQYYGDVVWDAEKREISYTYRAPWSIRFEQQTHAEHPNAYDPTFADGITGFRGTFTKNADGGFDVDGENLGHLSQLCLDFTPRYGGLRFSFSLTATHLLNDPVLSSLCWDMSTVRYDGERLQDNADAANAHMKIYINGNAVPIKEVTQGKGNNHEDFYFVLDADFEQDEVTRLEVVCQ